MSLQRQLGVLVPPDVIEEMRQVSREQVTLAFRICVRGVPHLRVEQLRGRTHQTRAAILHAQAAAEGDSDLSAAAKVLEYSMTLESGSGGLPITTLRRFRPEPGESAARSGLLVSQDTHVQLFAAFPALTLDCPLSPTGSRQEAERVKAALALVQSRDPVSSIEFGDPALAEETFMALTREAAALRAVDAVIDVRIHDEGGHRRLQANRWHFANEALTLFLELRDDGSRLGVTRDVTAPARSAKAGEPAAVRGRMN